VTRVRPEFGVDPNGFVAQFWQAARREAKDEIFQAHIQDAAAAILKTVVWSAPLFLFLCVLREYTSRKGLRMTTTKWVMLLIGLAVAGCVAMVGIVIIVWFFGFDKPGVDGLLPVYSIEQTVSAHPGFLRTTVTSATSVFVSDYDEYALQLQDVEPKNAIGRGPIGGRMVYTIPGQKPTDYIAVDEGSEMPAYAVYRNTQLPPFDWRHAKFQAMEYTGPIGLTSHKRTTDPALIEDVVSTLRDGTPVPSSSLAAGSVSNLYGVWLFSDQLPGLIYFPKVYAAPSGPVYLSESVVMVSANPNQWTAARWIPAGPLFTKWLQAP
jgi:hypothetical protein